MIAAEHKIERARCCHKCSPCPTCYETSLHELRDLVYAINSKVAGFAQANIQEVNEGYSWKTISEEDARLLIEYKEVLQRFYDELRIGVDMHGLCVSELLLVKEKALGLIDIRTCTAYDRSDITFDYSGYDEWVLIHPDCVAYESWEQSVCRIYPQFTVSVEMAKCAEAYYELTLQDEQCILPVIVAVAEEERCSTVSLDAQATAEECKFNYRALVKETKCDLSMTAYSNLINCNYSHNTIAQAVRCGFKVGFNVEQKCMTLAMEGSALNVDCHAEILAKAFLSNKEEA